MNGSVPGVCILIALCQMSVIAPSLSRPMAGRHTGTDVDGAGDASSAVVAGVHTDDGDVTEEDCHVTQPAKMIRCLAAFEVQYIRYSQPNVTEAAKMSMVSMLCHEYGQSLQCLHLLLVPCSPTNFELQLIAERVGYLRNEMDEACFRPKSYMTPASSSSRPTPSTRRSRHQHPSRGAGHVVTEPAPAPGPVTSPPKVSRTANIPSVRRDEGESQSESDAREHEARDNGQGQGHVPTGRAGVAPDHNKIQSVSGAASSDDRETDSGESVLCETTNGVGDDGCVQRLHQGYSAGQVTCLFQLYSAFFLLACSLILPQFITS